VGRVWCGANVDGKRKNDEGAKKEVGNRLKRKGTTYVSGGDGNPDGLQIHRVCNALPAIGI
jgi:hypothetical protein